MRASGEAQPWGGGSPRVGVAVAHESFWHIGMHVQQNGSSSMPISTPWNLPQREREGLPRGAARRRGMAQAGAQCAVCGGARHS